MPAIAQPISTQVTQPVQRRGFSLDDILKLPLNDVRNGGSSPLQCQMPYTPGKHERAASGLAISEAHGVLLARRDAAAAAGKGSRVRQLDQAIAWMAPGNGKPLGSKVLAYLTALGGTRGGLALMQREAPDDAGLKNSLKRLDDAIERVGLRIGKCDSPPDGYGHGGATNKLFDEIKRSAQVMFECAHEAGREDVMWSIARAMLPQAMKESIAERVPGASSQVINGEKHCKEVIEARVYGALQDVLRAAMESGEPVAFANAVLHLLKTPEYIETEVPGRNGDQPKTPEQARAPFNPWPGPGPQPFPTTGAPWAYSNTHAPVTVNNDLSEFMRNQSAPQLTDIRNLVNDLVDRSYALGLSHAENKQLRAENTALRKQNADLLELLRKDSQRLNLFAKGPDLVRVPAGASEDEVDTTVQQRNTAPPSDDQTLRTRLDPDSPRAPRVPNQTRQQDQLDQTNQNRQTTEQRSEQLLNSGGNGDGGPRNPRQDDHADSRNRLGGTQQLDQRQRAEQNRHLQRDDGSNRSRNTGGSNVDFDYRELSYYLQAAGFEKKTLPVDRHEPTSVRNKKGPNTVRASDVKQYVKERSENAGKPFVPPHTGTLNPPLPSSPGRFNELVQAFGRENIIPSLVAGAENTQRRSGSAPAPVPKKSDLQEGMEAFFRNSRLKFLEPAQRNTVPDSALPAQIPTLAQPSTATPPATPVLAVGSRAPVLSLLDPLPSGPLALRSLLTRSDSVSSIASDSSSSSDSSEDGFKFGKRIIAASRQSQPTLAPRGAHLPLRASAGAATPLAQLARSIPSAPTVDSVPRARTGAFFAQGPANGNRQDDLRKSILDGARKPGGGDERQVAFNAPRDPLAGINVDEILASIRDEHPQQSDMMPAALQADSLGMSDRELSADWSPLVSPISSSASSMVGDEPEDFDFDFEPERDNMVVQRSYSSVSMDSGRGSPPVPTEQVSWEPKPADRVADRVAVNPKASDIGHQRTILIEELSGRLKKKAS